MTFTKTNSSMSGSQENPSSNPYARTQEFNESAVKFASTGQYDQAISQLARALEVWRSCQTEDGDVYACMCSQCTSHDYSYHRKGVTLNTPPPPTTSAKQEFRLDNSDIDSDDSEVEHGYFHQNLLRIPCREHFDFSNVHSGVALIVIYNLAIVYHNKSVLLKDYKALMAKTLQLYLLVNESLNKFVADSQHACCSRPGVYDMGTLIQMVLMNNLGHLHSCLGNAKMSAFCTQKVIPILMCIIEDRNLRNAHSKMIGNLEGFVRSICQLILTSQCADAA